MSRTRSLVAVLAVAALGLSACGGSSDGGGSSGGGSSGGGGGGDAADLPECPLDALDAATEPVEVVVWHSYVAKTAETLEALATEYNASQDEVVVRVESQGNTYEELWKKYQQGAANADLPGIAILEDINTQAVIDSETVLPAQSCIDASDYDTSDFVPSVVDFYSQDGVLYPGTLNVSTPLLYYNKNHFRKAGLDPEDPPGTLAEVRSAAEAIKGAGIVETPLVLNLESWFIETWLTGDGLPVVDNDNGRGDGDTTASALDDPATVELYQWLKDMHDDGLLLAIPNAGGVDQYLAMAGQTASMLPATSTAATSVEAFLGGDTSIADDAGGEVDTDDIDLEALDFGAGMFPGISEPGKVQIGGGAWYITNTNPPEVQAAAWDFIVWWNRLETQVRWHLDGSYLPLSLEAAEDEAVVASWEGDDLSGNWLAISYDQLVNGVDPDFPGPLIGPFDQFRDANENGLDDMLLGSAEPADVVASVAADTTASIEQYNEETF